MRYMTPCYYRVEGVFCWGGYLHHSTAMPPEIITLEDGHPVNCPACHGKAQVLTDEGEHLMVFVDMFVRPMIERVVAEQQKQHD